MNFHPWIWSCNMTDSGAHELRKSTSLLTKPTKKYRALSQLSYFSSTITKLEANHLEIHKQTFTMPPRSTSMCPFSSDAMSLQSAPLACPFSSSSSFSAEVRKPTMKVNSKIGLRESIKRESIERSYLTNIQESNPILESYKLSEASKDALKEMRESWGVQEIAFSLDRTTPLTKSRLNMADAVMVNQSWNKVLAFRTMFAEALIGRWRMLVAADEISNSNPKASLSNEAVSSKALRLVENNRDPIARHFGTRTSDLDILLIVALDLAVNELCPHKVIQRESYSALNGSADADPRISGKFFHKDECKSCDQCFSLFASYGLLPKHWILFASAFIWTMKEHNPYSTDDEKNDLEKLNGESAHGRFIAGMFVFPMIESALRRESYLTHDVFVELRSCLDREELGSDFEIIGADMFNKLFEKFPEIADHFSGPDLEEMKAHLFDMYVLNFRVESCYYLPKTTYNSQNISLLLKPGCSRLFTITTNL